MTACSLVATLALGATSAQATTIALQPDGTVGKDAEINAVVPDTNLDLSEFLIINWSGGARSIGLIAFDLSAVPAGATINSATLSLFHVFNQASSATYSAFRVTSAWSESTVTFDTAPTFDPAAVSSLTFSGSPGVFRNWSVTSVVQGWVSGAFANNGLWIEEIPIAGAATAYFASSDASDPSSHPTLTIDFTAAPTAAVPEPSTLILFATGAAFVALRYRRR